MNRVDCVSILAGGGGTRLWPASTEQHPKQFMKIGGAKSLLLQTLERSWALEPTVGVFVVCNQNYIDEVLQEVALLGQERHTYVLPEPCMRNTAAALFYVNQLIEELAGPEAIQLVQTSDHLVSPQPLFAQAISQAVALARSRRIVVFGLEPRYPATGYGYIERGEPLGKSGFRVERFTEKPDRETAGKFIASGRFYWNSGMFCYPASLLQEEMRAWTPSIPQALAVPKHHLAARLRREGAALLLPASSEIEAAYEHCESISVDYAVMEKSQNLALLPADFHWDDIGSWDMLSTLESSSQPLVEVGESKGNFVRSSLPVALCDVRDLIVVEENGVLLVCRKGSSELVKEARARLRKQS
ncbi:MAG: sugar phosphate nucleotidyltransferase [Spirochaetota bacterium]